MNNVVSVTFEVESEAYKAFSELRSHLFDDAFVVSEAALLDKKDGRIEVAESVDSGSVTTDDTAAGLLIGAVVGIIGGPLGMLYGASIGALTGSTVDLVDASDNVSFIEGVTTKLYDNQTSIVAVVQEDDETAFDALFDQYACTIIRRDASAVAEDIELAREAEVDLQRQARAQLRAERKAEIKEKAQEHKRAIEERFDAIKAKIDADRPLFEQSLEIANVRVAEDNEKYGL